MMVSPLSVGELHDGLTEIGRGVDELKSRVLDYGEANYRSSAEMNEQRRQFLTTRGRLQEASGAPSGQQSQTASESTKSDASAKQAPPATSTAKAAKGSVSSGKGK